MDLSTSAIAISRREVLCASGVAALSAVVAGVAGCTATTSPPSAVSADPSKAQITVLYDAFGKASAMQKDWGYAALIDYGGKRILFDTGNNPDILALNAKAKDVDLSRLDFVVMSHRHGDHMGGIAYLLSVNPKVKIYAPKEGRRLWRRLAQHLLSQGRLPAAGAALLRRCSAGSDALRSRVARRQLPVDRQEHRDRPWCPSDLAGLRQARDPGAPRALARHQRAGRDGDRRGLLASRYRQDRRDGHRDQPAHPLRRRRIPPGGVQRRGHRENRRGPAR